MAELFSCEIEGCKGIVGNVLRTHYNGKKVFHCLMVNCRALHYKDKKLVIHPNEGQLFWKNNQIVNQKGIIHQ